MHGILLSAYLFMAAGDVATTCKAFNQGLVEGNPFYGSTSSCGKVAAIKGLTTGGATFLIEKKVKTKKGKIIGYAVLAGISAVPVVLNSRTMARHGGAR